LGGREPISLNTLVAEIGKAVGRRPRGVKIAVWPVMAAAVVCEKTLRPLGIEPPLYPRRVEFFTKDRAFTIEKARRVLGYEPKVTEAEGLARTAEWYRNNGLID